jgi:hypothetical protein
MRDKLREDFVALELSLPTNKPAEQQQQEVWSSTQDMQLSSSQFLASRDRAREREREPNH